MILKDYIAQRRELIGERIAAETLAGNEVKLAAEKSALAELDGLAMAIMGDRFYRISTDGGMITFEAHGISSAEVLIALIQSIATDTYRTLEAKKK